VKAFLLYRDQDFDLQRPPPPPNELDLIQDLELRTLFEAMALGDEFLFDVAKKAVLSSLADPDAIVYRQRILADCLEHAAVVREIYDLTVEAITGERKIYRGLLNHPEYVLHRSVEALEFFVPRLKRLRSIADEHADKFRSEGVTELFRMLAKELDDEYFQTIDTHLKRLRFRGGVLISAELGEGNKGSGYVLRKPRKPDTSWVQRIVAKSPPSYTYTIPDRDDVGAQALSELRDQGLNLVANALAQSTDHILSFFTMLRTELAFYVGGMNLDQLLADRRAPRCFPVPVAASPPALSCQGLYDTCLALTLPHRVTGNDIDADGKSLVMVTGANEGGKSTFLRSVGLAQLMMQSGLVVSAESFRASVCDGVFTHYRREEDTTMTSGKLDEELARMSTIADLISPNCVMLFNESFAATNEREGSEIARQITRALRERGIRIFFVTHMFDLAHSLYDGATDTALFLRAERLADGRRTFRMVVGEPSPTSHGEDLYRQVFGPDSA
jgi:DNA mismatch repair ATPase MutS